MELNLYLELETFVLEQSWNSLMELNLDSLMELNPCFSYTQVLSETCHILKRE